jgi:MoaA/NifB/PqqE/SkfB family radical SAM enzyme
LDFLWLEITNRCNLHFSHCYSGSGPHEPESGGLQFTDWQRLLHEAYALGCRSVQFIGGEPLLNQDLPELIRIARQVGFQAVEVFSNATRITDKTVRLFKQYDVMLATSFYSSDPHIHDSITRVRGSQQRTINSLKLAISGGIQLRVGIIVMDSNIHTEARTIEFLGTLGVKNTHVDRVRGIGRANTIVFAENPESELCGNCWRGTLAVNSSGNVSPCVFSHFYHAGHVSDGLEAIIHGSLLQTFRRKFKQINEQQQLSCASNCAPASCDPAVCHPIKSCHPSDCHPRGK